MLYYCAYTWHSGTNAQKAGERFLQQEAAGLHFPETWRGWYALAGGGSGFLLVETEDHRQLTQMLQPYMELVSWEDGSTAASVTLGGLDGHTASELAVSG